MVQLKSDIYTVSESALEVVHYSNILAASSKVTVKRLSKLGKARDFFAAVNFCGEAICITGGIAEWRESVYFFIFSTNEWVLGPRLTISRQ